MESERAREGGRRKRPATNRKRVTDHKQGEEEEEEGEGKGGEKAEDGEIEGSRNLSVVHCLTLGGDTHLSPSPV